MQFTNLASGANFQEGSGLEATTTTAQSVEILLDGRIIEVFDTPGPDADETGKAKAHLIRLLHDSSVAMVECLAGSSPYLLLIHTGSSAT